jgi:hypothetical protein
MKRSLNLMSLSTRRQECIRTRLRQWSVVLVAVIVLIVIVTTERYIAYRYTARQQFALEAKYEPITELKKANKHLANQIVLIRAEEQFVLALSEREPTITLLGLVSAAVAEGNSHVFLKKIELTNIASESAPQDGSSTILEVVGIGNGGAAVKQFTEALQNSLPFAKVDITSTNDYSLKQQPMQDFSLQCNF